VGAALKTMVTWNSKAVGFFTEFDAEMALM
jgi:hypothetical protein